MNTQNSMLAKEPAPQGEVAAMAAAQWITRVAALLQARWPSIDPARLDDLAADLWRERHLRSLDAESAARLWLEPVSMNVSNERR